MKPYLADPSLHPYHRYALTGEGISPIRFPPVKGEVVRVNSHVHDPPGVTTEEPELTIEMADKRKRKAPGLLEEIEGMNPVKVSGTPYAADTILC